MATATKTATLKVRRGTDPPTPHPLPDPLLSQQPDPPTLANKAHHRTTATNTMDQLPLSTVIEAAMQRAENDKQLDYLFELIMTIEHLEACFELEAVDK